MKIRGLVVAGAKKRALGRLCGNDVALAAMRSVLQSHGFAGEASELAAHAVLKPSAPESGPACWSRVDDRR